MGEIFDFDEAENQRKADEERRRHEQIELKELLENSLARKFIFQQWVDSYIFSTTFTGNSQGFKEEGKREQALKSFNAVLELDANLFAQMYKEYTNASRKS